MLSSWKKTVTLFLGLLAPGVTFASGLCDTPTNLVQDCGFEATNTFATSPWSVDQLLNTASPPTIGVEAALANSGNNFAAFGSIPAGADGGIYQDLQTQIGTTYIFSFYLGSDGQVPDDFKVKWGGTTIYSQNNLPNFNYSQLTFSETATSSITRIEFEGSDQPYQLALDDVFVGVPEPSVAILTPLLLLVPFGIRRYQKRAV